MLKVYNTLTSRKEIFQPLEDRKVKMFVCGPTVYDYSHLGHARTYTAYDTIAKWLRFRGFDLTFVMNITDVDDKIIRRAKEQNKDPIKLAREFEKFFYEDIKILGIDSIDIFARASEHIPEIISQIKRLIERGYAYVTSSGVYYDITKFEDYGKLSHQNLKELKKHRIEPDPTKKHEQDFSLWKVTSESKPKWDLEIELELPKDQIDYLLGKGSERYVEVSENNVKISILGRPGWHIEDTAIAEKYLGQQYDIHGGGQDLIFPHHESEIAQMESVTGRKPFVKYWIHTGFLMVRGQKMAKSLRNFITVREATKNWDPEVLRLFFASAHYRTQINYDEKNLEQAKSNLERLYNTLRLIEETKENKKGEEVFEKKLEKLEEKFQAAMDDDFNTPEALKVLFQISTEINKFLSKKVDVSKKLKERMKKTLKEFGGIFGILKKETKKEELSEEILELIKKRENLRKLGKFEEADEIRKKLREEFEIILEDTKDKARWRKVK